MAKPQLRDAADELDALLSYVRVVADSVGLRDHSFEVRVGVLSAGTRATIECVEGRRYSRITVSDHFFDLSAEEQREAITHEVVHAHLHVLTEHVEHLGEFLGRSHHTTISAGFSRDLERVCDSLTSALVRVVPLPEW